MAERAFITPNVLKWARTTAKMTLEEAASKVSVSVERIEQWEQGDSYPTIRQAQKLAKSYQRPFAVFFLPDIPNDFQPLTDFRKSESIPLSTSSIFIIREIQKKQAWISEQNQEDGFGSKDFVGKFSQKTNTQTVANDILKVLEIDPLNYNKENPILEWIDKAESNGIFVSRTSFIHSRLKLDKNQIQGFAIADPHAPFIFINSDDWNAPQLFTLVHELAHIWIASSGISNAIEPELGERTKYNPIELFCNEVAAKALLPEKFLRSLSSSDYAQSKQIFKLAKRIGVSSYALLVRLRNLNLIDHAEYSNLKKQSDMDFEAFLKREAEKKKLQKQKKGGPNYYLLQLNRNSRLFTQIVLDSFKGGRIEPNFASNLLNVKANKFNKLEERLYA
jgi:Zn-dependent peptidase ImmA (M78 family)/DNA-binding XRE family transcriptional regulator